MRRQRNFKFFEDLPPELTMDILCRLPVLSVYTCKCVCKSWLDLLKTDEFVRAHLAKAVPGLAVNDPESCKIFEFVDDLGLEEHEDHYDPVTAFHCYNYGLIHGSANGLIFLCQKSLDSDEHDMLYLFNPMAVEYIQLRGCEDFRYNCNEVLTYGFGAGRVSGELKVVRISHLKNRGKDMPRISRSTCQVYTLGTGEWRTVGPCPEVEYSPTSFGALLHGNLHWLTFDLESRPLISCFDIEDETFSVFNAPPGLPRRRKCLIGLYAMEDCLCLSDGTTSEFVIWLLRDYGGGKRWSKEFVIRKTDIPNFEGPNFHIVRPLKIFRDGDVLMAWGGLPMFYYCAKTKSYEHAAVIEMYIGIEPILFAPSLILLGSFANEKVFLREY